MSGVKVYLVTRLHRSDYSVLLLDASHPIVQNNDLSEYQMLCINKSDHDLAMRRKDKEIELLREQRNKQTIKANKDYEEGFIMNLIEEQLDSEITKAVGEIL